jgi:hypothetical protein
MSQPFSPPITEGAGKAGAKIAPIASRAKTKNTQALVTTGTPSTIGLPCAVVLRLTPRSSRRSGFFVTVTGAMREHCRQLDVSVETSEPRGFAVRSSRARLTRQSVHRIPQPNVRDDRDTPLFSGTGWRGLLKMICPSSQVSRLRHIGTTGKSAWPGKSLSRILLFKQTRSNCFALQLIRRMGGAQRYPSPPRGKLPS